MPSTLQLKQDGPVAWLTLNRPDRHNAFDDSLITDLTAALRDVGSNDTVRAVVLAANGKSFSAGADLGWMQRAAAYGEAENRRDAEALSALLTTLDTLQKPTLARVQGAAYGGGVGLVAACDIALGCRDARFALTEVRLGLAPAVISPFVIAAIGNRQARRLFLTAERFDADHAAAIGLLHEVCDDEAALDQMLDRCLDDLLAGGPAAQAAAKKLVRDVSQRPHDNTLHADNATLIARLRASPEGREGLAAFFDKRPPAWRNREI